MIQKKIFENRVAATKAYAEKNSPSQEAEQSDELDELLDQSLSSPETEDPSNEIRARELKRGIAAFQGEADTLKETAAPIEKMNMLAEVDAKLSTAVQELLERESAIFEQNAERVLGNELVRTQYLREVTGPRLDRVAELVFNAEKTSVHAEMKEILHDIYASFGAEATQVGSEANDALIDAVDVLRQVTLKEGSAEKVTVNLEPIQRLEEIYARLAETSNQGHQELQQKINNSILRLAREKAGDGVFKPEHIDAAEAELREKYSKAFADEKALRENAAFARNQVRLLRAIELAATTPDELLAEEKRSVEMNEFDESLLVTNESLNGERFRIVLGAEPETKSEFIMVNEDRLEQSSKLKRLLADEDLASQVVAATSAKLSENKGLYDEYLTESGQYRFTEATLSSHMQQVFEVALQLATDDFESRAYQRTLLAEQQRAGLADSEIEIKIKAQNEAKRKIAEQLPKVISRVKKQALLKTGIVEHMVNGLAEVNEKQAPHNKLNNSTIEGMEVAIVLSAIYDAAESEPTLRSTSEVDGSSPDADAYRLLSELAIEMPSLRDNPKAVPNRILRFQEVALKMIGGVEGIDDSTIIAGDEEHPMDTLDLNTEGAVQLIALKNPNTRSKIDPARYRRLE
ncbi:hypothetical protein KC573_01275 [candidate division WWE3 bacterium]|uniref:Uncharacterized protein n=1 Tax=candidate division WWE3 bacterium TaxID=2053526 RepID=A0A955LVD4_UNCKA|nr:hypothetical protein [candidate division WWE3 bacterium]